MLSMLVSVSERSAFTKGQKRIGTPERLNVAFFATIVPALLARDVGTPAFNRVRSRSVTSLAPMW